MKKISILILTISMALMVALTSKVHAYTLSLINGSTYYNQTTANIGQADLLDMSNTYIEYMYFNLGTNVIDGSTIRVVFSYSIPTIELPIPALASIGLEVKIRFYDLNDVVVYESLQYYNQTMSFTYFETNFTPNVVSSDIDYITISISNLSYGYDEDTMHTIMNGAIIVIGNTIINQTIGTTQYSSGWTDAMNSKVTQIWTIWGNIFDTFMNVFDIFSIQLVGDITIGHIAMVPLVLGLIGFIYALGGKRGR